MSDPEECKGCRFFIDGECTDEDATDLENCWVASDSELGEEQ